MVTGTNCCNVEQLPLGCHDLVELELVCDVGNAGTQRQHALIAGNHKRGFNSRPLARCIVPIRTASLFGSV